MRLRELVYSDTFILMQGQQISTRKELGEIYVPSFAGAEFSDHHAHVCDYLTNILKLRLFCQH